MSKKSTKTRHDNIEDLGNGRYRVFYCCGYYANGRQRRGNKIIEASSRTEAKVQLCILNGEFAKHRNALQNKKQTLADFGQFFIDVECAINRKDKIKTVTEYRSKFKNHIVPTLGHLQLQAIKPKHIDHLIEALQQPGAKKPPANAKKTTPKKDLVLGAETIRHCFRLLSAILQFAYEKELIDENPAKRRKAPKVPKHQLPKFPPSLVDDLQAALQTEPLHYRVFIMTKIFTGCRESELFGLTWNNVNFAAKTIFISQTRQYISSVGIVIDPLPKNDSSIRHISLPPKLVDLLQKYMVEQQRIAEVLCKKWSPTGFVFVNELGDPMHPATLSEWMIRFRARHNLMKLTSKDLRHLHATILGKAKIPVKNASSRMGHAKVSTTLDIYSHDFQDSDELIANKLDELVKIY